ncbi:Hypothetical protein NTJ_05915 [Nesidiocoris tenuis]|uniref:Attacin C-terminal domain-containing protein n=1 Tax=Nesidiocoris tenuis TaxID=355587 RepID=A0ABN7AQC5_9HEMI|nr:Hypothetical protein NTJ_05915 [Nesidiocoris tenuis]
MKLAKALLILSGYLLHALCQTANTRGAISNPYIGKLLYEITHDLPGFIQTSVPVSSNENEPFKIHYDINKLGYLGSNDDRGYNPAASFFSGQPGSVGFSRTDGVGYSGDLGDGKHLTGNFGGFHTETVESGKSDDYSPGFGSGYSAGPRNLGYGGTQSQYNSNQRANPNFGYQPKTYSPLPVGRDALLDKNNYYKGYRNSPGNSNAYSSSFRPSNDYRRQY